MEQWGTKTEALASFPPLAPREAEIFRLLGVGATFAEIAAGLGISPKTVSTYMDRLRLKLDGRPNPIQNMAQLRVYAGWLREGFPEMVEDARAISEALRSSAASC